MFANQLVMVASIDHQMKRAMNGSSSRQSTIKRLRRSPYDETRFIVIAR
jgi:hypothetical protein